MERLFRERVTVFMGYQNEISFPFRLSSFRLKEQELAKYYSPRAGSSLESRQLCTSCQLCTSSMDVLLWELIKLSSPDEIENAD